MAAREKVIELTVFAWCLITIVCAYLYIIRVLSTPNLQGYETEWQFQLLMFSIFRLPWLLLALGLIVWAEIKFMNK